MFIKILFVVLNIMIINSCVINPFINNDYKFEGLYSSESDTITVVYFEDSNIRVNKNTNKSLIENSYTAKLINELLSKNKILYAGDMFYNPQQSKENNSLDNSKTNDLPSRYSAHTYSFARRELKDVIDELKKFNVVKNIYCSINTSL
ncbi:MAG: hypothetical protein U0354_09905 [Candidatus Sericytochromatia bacterium]